MEYAIIKTGGKQYKVSSGDIIEIDKIPQEKGDFMFEQVLLTVLNGKTKIGNPFIKGEKVSATIIEQIKGEKIRVAKFKSKVRFRRVSGFRPLLTKVKIVKIGSSGEVRREEKPKAVTKKSK